MTRRYSAFLAGTDFPLADICFTALIGRNHFADRLAVLGGSAAAIRAALEAFVANRPADGLFISHAPADEANATPNGPPSEGRRAAVMTEAAMAYVAGRDIDARALYGARRQLALLPTYPFQRQRYWFDGSRSRAVQRSAAPSGEVAHCFHLTDWKETPVVERPLPDTVSDVLVIGDGRGVGNALVDLLRARSRRCFVVEKGDGFVRLSPTSWSANPAQPEQLARAASEIAAENRSLSDLVFLATSDEPPVISDTSPASTLQLAQVRGTFGLIGVLQALLALGTRLPRLWIVTRGAVRVPADTAAINLSHATVWGLLRTLLLEQPGLQAVAVDLARDGVAVRDEASVLLGELGAPSGEDHIAWRGRRRLVARLHRRAPAAQRPLSIAPDRCHLVTGGVGGIGLRLTEWLVRRGARDVVLTTRRAPDQKTEAALHPLRALGARVEIATADVADESSMTALLDRLDRAGRPLAGVMHLAGVLDDMLLAQVRAESFEATLRPKLSGSWVLHRLTRNRELDYFVLFSSIASGFGAPGQSCYAAANAFLDALAHWRRSGGLPALSVNFGPWSGDGMARDLSPAYLRRNGRCAAVRRDRAGGAGPRDGLRRCAGDGVPVRLGRHEAEQSVGPPPPVP